MVACLEKTEENAEFHQIVDFLSTCLINYALTASPTIYASYIEQFWNTATSKTVNLVKQIHAIVDGKVVVISESLVRSDLLFNDEDGIACLTNDKFFENLALMGYEQQSTKLTFQKGKVTPLFDSMLVQKQAPDGEGSSIPPEPQPTPSISQPTVSEPQTAQLQTETPPSVSHEPQTEAHIEQILPSPSTYHRKHRKTQKHRRAKKVTELPQTSVPIDLGADEAIHKEGVTGIDTGGSPMHQEIIGGALAQTRSERVLEKPNEPPLLEEREGCTSCGDPQTKAKSQEIRKKEEVKHLTPRRRIYRQVESFDDDLDKEDASEQGRISDKTKLMFKDSDFDDLDDLVDEGMDFVQEKVTEIVDIAGEGVSITAPRTPPITTTIFDDEDVNMAMAQTLIKMKEEKAKEKGVAIKDVEDSSRPVRSITTLQPLPTINPKNKGKGVLVEEEPEKPVKVKRRDQGLAQTESDAELAQRLHEEELAEFDRAQKERQKQEATSAALAEEFDEIQAKIDVDHKLAQAESTKKKPRAYSEEESSKKQKLEEDNDAEKEELRDSIDVVPRDDVAIDVESLATKYPIVDWKTHILNENMMYYQIIRVDGSSKNYKIFSEMLDDFDRQDVIDLHRLVNERYETTSPEGYDLLLWGDLKTLFEPNEEDEIWKNQQDYNLISWRLFDSCGVHVLLMNTGVAIHMMIEKKYPLTQEMLSRMLNRRLEVDYESEMAFHKFRSRRVFGYILLMIKMMILKKLDD
ncbi:hypothetical protein Tco_1532357 [Tanacetum coccineum]